MRKRLALAIAASALAFPAAAQAHVTVQPNTAAAGSFTVFDVRVPNEEDAANTTKVDVQFPPGFAEVSYQPVPGWKVRVIKGKLAKPVKTDDGLVTDEVRRMIWTGGKIAPGQFTDFPISVQVPGKNGQSLTFKALQTYSNGKVVRWIGPESSDTPAPTVKLAAAATPAATKPVAATTSSSSSDSGDSASKGLGIAALIVGVLGLLAGLAALLTSRRRASGS
jgi:uncharacterized protein